MMKRINKNKTREEITKEKICRKILIYCPHLKGRLKDKNVYWLFNYLAPCFRDGVKAEFDLLSELKYEAAKHHGHIRGILDQLTIRELLYHLPKHLENYFINKTRNHELDRKKLVRKKRETQPTQGKLTRKKRRIESTQKPLKRRI